LIALNPGIRRFLAALDVELQISNLPISSDWQTLQIMKSIRVKACLQQRQDLSPRWEYSAPGAFSEVAPEQCAKPGRCLYSPV